MDLHDVMTQVGEALDTIDGLRVYGWAQRSVSPPAALVTLPEGITFDNTYGRGSDVIRDLVVLVLAGRAEERTATRQLAAYADGSGDQSVKAAVESYPYTGDLTVHVASVDFDGVTLAGVEYLGAMFHLNITGPGTGA
ncbi:MAG TPA: hypothetical protein VD864_13865 [Nocardioides sp.]|nr:hypothetical protein [Nocardioides sp.]